MKFERIYHPDSARMLAALERVLSAQPRKYSWVTRKTITPEMKEDIAYHDFSFYLQVRG